MAELQQKQLKMRDAVQAFYADKSGNDSYNGKSIGEAKLNLSVALSAASAASPSPSNRINVNIFDAGEYDGGDIDDYVSIDGAGANCVKELNIANNSRVVWGNLIPDAGESYAIKKTGGNVSYVDALVVGTSANNIDDAFIITAGQLSAKVYQYSGASGKRLADVQGGTFRLELETATNANIKAAAGTSLILECRSGGFDLTNVDSGATRCITDDFTGGVRRFGSYWSGSAWIPLLGIDTTNGKVDAYKFSINGGQVIDEISTDTTMAGDSNTVVVTEHVAKTYIDNAISVENLWDRVTGTPNYLIPHTVIDDIGATAARIIKGWFTDLEITNMPTVGGTSINANNVLDLASGEVSQLTNIGSTTISAAQWGYLGNMDQGIATTDNLTFNALTISTLNTVNGIVQTNGSGVFSSSVTLPNGTLATTQSPGDNTTKVATTAFVTAAVNIEDLWDRVTGTPNYLIPKTVADNIGATGARITKGWFTDLEITNMPTVGGVSINNNGALSLSATEVTQLANIGTTTISAGQWGYLGAADQNITTTSDVTFNTLTISSTSLLKGNVTIGDGTADTDFNLTFNGENSDGTITWMEDEGAFRFGTGAEYLEIDMGATETDLNSTNIIINLQTTTTDGGTRLNVISNGTGQSYISGEYGGDSNANWEIVQGATAAGLDFGSSNTKFTINNVGRDLDVIIEGDNNQYLLATDAGNDRVGVNTGTPLGKLAINQNTVDAAIPALWLQQADVSEGFIDFNGTDKGAIPTSTVNSVASVRVELNGIPYMLALHANIP